MAKSYNQKDKYTPLESYSDISMSDTRLYRVSGVYYGSLLCMDVRQWVKFRGREGFHPTKKGIFLDVETFKEKLLPTIIRFLNLTPEELEKLLNNLPQNIG